MQKIIDTILATCTISLMSSFSEKTKNWCYMNEVISNPVNLDSSIRIQTIHNGYLYGSPDQGLQSLDLGFLI